MKSICPVFPGEQSGNPLSTLPGNCKPAGKVKWFISCCIFAALLLFPSISFSRVVYVSPNGAGSQNGSSWGNACTLGAAAYDWTAVGGQYGNGHGIANPGDTIWMEQGTYTQDLLWPFGYAFMGDVIGGFNGTETSASQANPLVNVTTIVDESLASGQGKVIVVDVTGMPILQGITFNSDLVTYDNLTDLNFINCNFQNCQIGMDSIKVNLNASGCSFNNNTNTLFCDGTNNAAARFNNCSFKNYSTRCPVVICGASANFNACVFDNNTATNVFANGAGGIYVTAGQITVTNCLFTNNNGTYGGAIALTTEYAYVVSTISNNTFVSNSTPYGQTALAYLIAQESNPGIIANNIFVQGGLELASGLNVVNTNNLTDPPLNPDYTPTACSVAVNGGSNSYVRSGETTDLAGNPRIANGIVDAGCYEYQGSVAPQLFTYSSPSICAGLPVTIELPYVASSGFTWYETTTNGTDSISTWQPVLTVSPVVTTTYTVRDTAAGCSYNRDSSITITVYPALVAPTAASQSPSTTSICAGTLVKATGNPGSGGMDGCVDHYRYSIDGGNTWHNYTQGNNISTDSAVGVVIVEANRFGCADCNAIPWNQIASWTVTPLTAPSIIITANATNILPGTTVTFQAIAFNAGTPFYQWQKNGHNVGNNFSQYLDNSLNNGDVITCIVTGNQPCSSQLTATSNAIQIVVTSIGISQSTTCLNSVLTASFSFVPAEVQWSKPGLGVNDYPSWSSSATTVAGGSGTGALNNQFHGPNRVFADNLGNIYVADAGNNRIMKWVIGAPAGVVVAGGNGAGNALNQLNTPQDVFADDSANLYIADAGNNRIVKWPSGATSGIVVAGGNGAGTAANQFNFPCALSVQPSYGYGITQIYVCDKLNNRIQLWQEMGSTGTTVAGGNGAGSGANQLNQPTGFCVVSGELFIADNGNNRVQHWFGNYRITVAGGNGPGVAPNQLRNPNDVWVDNNYNVYVSDAGNYRIQRWNSPAWNTGVTIVGGNGPGERNNQLYNPTGLTFDNSGNLYVCDSMGVGLNDRVQKFVPHISDTLIANLAGNYSINAIAFSNNIGNVSSNTVSISGPVTPGVSISVNNNIICPGMYVTFTPSPVNGGIAPGYQWYRNDTLLTTTTGPLTTNMLAANDVVYCIMTSDANCLATTTASSNTVTMQPFVVSVNITASPNYAVCSGTPITLNATSINGGSSPAYQWVKNGLVVSTDSSYTSASFNNNDSIVCVLTNNTSGCIGSFVDTSNSIVLAFNPALVPGVGLSTISGNTICAGSYASFAAQPINGGTAPAYQWYVNGNPSGSNSAIYNSNTFNNGDALYCVMTSNSACLTAATAISDTIVMTVNPTLTPSLLLSITSGSDTSCTGSAVTFTATPVNAGNSPLYVFKVNGAVAQLGPPTYTTSALNNNDSVTCTVTYLTNHACLTTNTATSNSIIMTINLPPVISCPSSDTVDADMGLCSSGAPIGIPVVSGGCGTVAVTCSPVGPYPVGTTMVTWKALDQNGDSATCTQLVTVIDNQLPTITAPSTVIVNTDSGHCYATNVSLGIPVTADNCGVQSVTNNAPFQYPVGNTTITWTVTDIHNNVNTATQIVTVMDNQLPTITAPSTVIVNADSGHCYATNVSLGTPVTADNCGVQSVTNNAPLQYPVGSTTVTWTVTDIHNNVNTATQIVTVTDNQPPVVTCLANIAVTANQSVCNKPLTIGTPATSDNCGIASVTNNFNNTANASGTYPVGTTNILWTVTDIHSNVAFCTQMVTIYPCIQISGTTSNTICSRTSNGSVSITANGGNGTYSYHWNNGLTTAAIANLASGNYIVTVTDQWQGSATASFTVGTTIPASRPATPAAISGPATFCQNATNTYSIGTVAYATSYTWSVPANATILSGQGTTQLTVKFAANFTGGVISVVAGNCVGNSGKSNLTVTLFNVPVPPASITGAGAVCAGSSQTYTAASVADASSYTWTAPANATITAGQGSSSVTVQFNSNFTNGNLKVYASNCIGRGNPASLPVNLMPVPAKPGNPSGATAVCSNVVYQYTIAPVINANSYYWTVPANATLVSGQGTTSVSIQYSGTFNNGNVGVYAISCSGNSAVQNIAIRKLAVPVRPGTISGNTKVCDNFIYQYAINTVANADLYTWVAPANATITSGQGTTSVTVAFASSFTSGVLDVYASDCSGNGASQSINLTETNKGCGTTKALDDTTSGESASKTGDNNEVTNIDLIEGGAFGVNIYPNPFSQQFHISIQSPNTDPVQISVFTIEGKLIETKTVEFTGLDIETGANLSAGVYLVRIAQQDKTAVLRLIKSE